MKSINPPKTELEERHSPDGTVDDFSPWNHEFEEFDIVTEDQLKAIEQLQSEKAAAQILEDNREYTEKYLRAPCRFILDNFIYKPGQYAKIGDLEVSIDEGISAMISGKSGFIVGPGNTGKSFLAVAIARERKKRALRLKDFWFAIFAEVNKYRHSESYKNIVDNAGSCDTLIIDDIGKNECQRGEGPTHYGNVILSIVDDRAENNKQTIATTRYCDEEVLKSRLSDDLIRRINQTESKEKNHVSIILGG